MIGSVRDETTRRLAAGERPRRIPPDVLKRARMRLDRLQAAERLDDLRVPPSHHLESLSGDRTGQWSIRVNDQWRICFEWREAAAWNVEFTNYH
ncbi:MAG: type II toxin-antitoxin system RelE/ParE family toxin [Panacagrimonas sp.]